jgi:hypothetical protein
VSGTGSPGLTLKRSEEEEEEEERKRKTRLNNWMDFNETHIRSVEHT